MELKEAIYKRRSIRKYKDIPVKDDDIDLLLHYGMAGPSACNKRPWQFYIVKNEAKKEEIRKITRYSNIVAPVYIVVCGDMKKAMTNDFWVQDCSAAIENILLGAVDLGLGTCWIGIYPFKNPPAKLRIIIETEDNIIPLGVIALGYPNESLEARDQYDKKRIHFIE